MVTEFFLDTKSPSLYNAQMPRTNNWSWEERGADKTMSHLLSYGVSHDVAGAYMFNSNNRSTVLPPEKRLLMAILVDAIELVQCEPQTKKKTNDRTAALKWIEAPRSDWLCSFGNICEYLGFDAESARKAILKN